MRNRDWSSDVCSSDLAAAVARRMGHEPRVAFLSYSTFGNPSGRWLDSIRGAVSIIDAEDPGFEYEGEMAPDAALNPQGVELLPFHRLPAPAQGPHMKLEARRSEVVCVCSVKAWGAC